MIFKFAIPEVAESPAELAAAFSVFLGAFGPAEAFLPAGAKLELAHYFAFAKFEPLDWASSTMSSGLGSEKVLAENDVEEV